MRGEMVNQRKIAWHRDKIFTGYFSGMQTLLLGNSSEGSLTGLMHKIGLRG